MAAKTQAIFELNKIVDDPRFEGFALKTKRSNLGRDTLNDDLTPGFAGADENTSWEQPSLASRWKLPKVVGRVSEFNDYPCINMIFPAFSERAVSALRPLLEANGEILPLSSSTKTKYFFYNIRTISNALDVKKSQCDFWCDPPTTAVDIERIVFHEKKVDGLSIFRIHQFPMSVLVTDCFVNRVEYFGLQGFSFTKVWPLPVKVNWRMQKSPEREKISKLKSQSVIFVIPFDCSPTQKKKISKFEDNIDLSLRVDHPSDRYLGSYEGHDLATGEYRMFFSAPNAELLFVHLSSL